MKAVDPPSQASRRGSKPLNSSSITRTDTAPEPQSFEWIPHGDASARRRARAHISRGFRRKKALEAQEQKETRDITGIGSTSSSSPETLSDSEHAIAKLDGAPPGNEKDGTIDVRSPAQRIIEEIILSRTLGHGMGSARAGDPFALFSMKLSPREQATLDHCKYTRKTRKSNMQHTE